MVGGFYKKRHNVGQRIPTNQLRPGMLIHLSHTNFACVWKIVSIEQMNSKGEIWLNLVAQESGNTRRSNAIYATYIRADER
ncbi:MAG: hypothetical protein D4R63_06100 [Methylococcaceae bacterium]|nr:MAG: hypothetical protein D4R63_06100 [Methylococcaceae bacterium]